MNVRQLSFRGWLEQVYISLFSIIMFCVLWFCFCFCFLNSYCWAWWYMPINPSIGEGGGLSVWLHDIVWSCLERKMKSKTHSSYEAVPILLHWNWRILVLPPWSASFLTVMILQRCFDPFCFDFRLLSLKCEALKEHSNSLITSVSELKLTERSWDLLISFYWITFYW